MIRLSLRAEQISKTYNGFDFVLKDIDFEIKNGEIFGIFGKNGSGKTTLLKILAGLLSPSQGKVIVEADGKILSPQEKAEIQGFVAPYLTLFEELTPLEHLRVVERLRGKKIDLEKATNLIEYFELHRSVKKTIREFSSGMKQRFKYILALTTLPNIFFLDEPFSNLDESGAKKVEELITNFENEGKIIVIATNERREARFCTKSIALSELSWDEPNFDTAI